MSTHLHETGYPPPPLPVDEDGDGWAPPDDCDDSDDGVHPDATELPYNGVDEDCDGSDLQDVDGDGFNAQEVGGEDCADANPSIHPDAEELCGDGRDNDCDEQVDEGCSTADPTNPGGLSWTCDQGPGAAGIGVFLLAFALVVSRRAACRFAGRGPG